MAQSTAPLSEVETAERLRGIALLCLAVLSFSFLDSAAKYASHYVPTIEVAFARYGFSLAMSVMVLRPWAHLREYYTRRPVVQILRAAALAGSTVLNFAALRYLQLTETVSIMFAAPLMVTALAGPVLGEWAGPRRWAAVVVGFIGVLIVIQPEPSNFQPAAMFSVAAAICQAIYALTTRLLSATDTPSSMLIYGSLLATVALAPTLPAVGVVPPGWQVLGALAVTGLMGSIGHWFLILANRHAPATVLAPFGYTQLIWMISLGYFLFGDVPKRTVLVGAAIIVASGLYVLYRERVHHDR